MAGVSTWMLSQPLCRWTIPKPTKEISLSTMLGAPVDWAPLNISIVIMVWAIPLKIYRTMPERLGTITKKRRSKSLQHRSPITTRKISNKGSLRSANIPSRAIGTKWFSRWKPMTVRKEVIKASSCHGHIQPVWIALMLRIATTVSLTKTKTTISICLADKAITVV